MNIKKCLLALAIATLLLSCSDTDRQEFFTSIEAKGELVVAMDIDMPGYFALEEQQYGYHYDMLQDYADRLGVTLRIIAGKTHSECLNMLDRGEVDLVAGITPGDGRKSIAMPIYTTSYVILAGQPATGERSWRKQKIEISLESMQGKRVLISSGFKASKHYDQMMDSVRNTPMFISEKNALDLMKSLSDGEYDYLVCERSEAVLGTGIYPGLMKVYDFEEGVQIMVTPSKGIKGLKEDFTAWLDEYRSGYEYEQLGNIYLENASPEMFSAFRSAAGFRAISQYDEVIRAVADKEGLDWRFLAAIAYHESRFKPHVVSQVGARGIMQIMPVVARNFNVPIEKMAETETNVTLAAKLLKSMEKTIGLPANIPHKDKIGIMVACYNAGAGHIADARRLARKYGFDANSWENVSRFLALKSQPEYYCDEVVRNGMFSGGKQTSNFVDKVIRQYNNYCILAQR